MKPTLPLTKARLKAGTVLTALALLGGCGGGSNDNSNSSTNASTSVGVLTDAPIGGVPYTTSPSGQSGTTSSTGEYNYRAGDTVTFTVAGQRFTVTASGEISPATLASALYPDHADNATLNLSMLFQSLDSDGNLDNGITIDADKKLAAGFAPDTELVKSPTDFQSALSSVLPAGYEAVSPNDAFEHLYKTQVPGNWRAVSAVRLKEGGVDVPEAERNLDLRSNQDVGFILSIDAEGHFAYTTWDMTGTTDEREADAAVGQIDFQTDEDNQKQAVFSRIKRSLSKWGSSTDEEDLFGATLKLSGDKLVVSIPGDNAATVTYERLNNVKGSLTGAWVENTDIAGTDFAQVVADGTLYFGGRVDGLFTYFLDNNHVVMSVLDIDEGDDISGEKNGVVVAEFTRNSTGITFTNILYDGVSLTEDPTINVGAKLNYVSSKFHDTERKVQPEDNGSDDTEAFKLYRILSNTEKLGSFKLGESKKLTLGFNVTGTTSGVVIENDGFTLSCNPDAEIGNSFNREYMLVFLSNGGLRLSYDNNGESTDITTLNGSYTASTGEIAWQENEAPELVNSGSTNGGMIAELYRQFTSGFSGTYNRETGQLSGSEQRIWTSTWNLGTEQSTCSTTMDVSSTEKVILK